ncbi:unnamed protein product [Pieris macdunnoughi]|uniref:Uncharacterized protein n=1 Tax=Pieris macdunnoughi TaxID=345717 RepID=A0A821NRP5_9NEOP|nr:unnamed protein product [Pieris macdunnoughi]
MCQVEQDTNSERDEAHKGFKGAAENMIDTTVKKLPQLNIGNGVLVSIPKVDHAKNIQDKVIDISKGVHKFGTKYGTIQNWFSRQQLQYSDTDNTENYIVKSIDDEISEHLISLREAVASQSPFGGQGFRKCNFLCGSKCHGSLSCINK